MTSLVYVDSTWLGSSVAASVAATNVAVPQPVHLHLVQSELQPAFLVPCHPAILCPVIWRSRWGPSSWEVDRGHSDEPAWSHTGAGRVTSDTSLS